MLYVIYHKSDYLDYILNAINDPCVNKIDLNEECNLLHRFFRKILPSFLSFPSLLIGGNLRNMMGNMRKTDTLLIIGYTNKNLIFSFSKLTPLIKRKYLWLWNPLKIKYSLNKKIDYIKKLDFEICTFNHKDSEKYKLTLKNQFYDMYPKNIELGELKFDFYFLGSVKNRMNEINILKQHLDKFKIYFHIVETPDQIIPYRDNINFIKQSRCIVDLIQKEQTGITLRPLEALAFQKKLITNNINIKTETFYHSKNIFIIGIDNINDIENFLSVKSHFIEDTIFKEYDVNTWLNFFK